MQRFGEGLASQEFENFANRLADLAGIGRATAESGVGLANVQSELIGTSIQDAGKARGTGFREQSTAIAGGITGLTEAINEARSN